MRALLVIFLVVLTVVGIVGFYYSRRPLPKGLDYRSPERILSPEQVTFFADVTASTEEDERWVRQEIFDEVFRRISEADGFVVMDFFLINEFAGGAPEGAEGQSLSQGLIDVLVKARGKQPEMPIILISDPLNTLYGGVEQPLFEELEANGIQVVTTDIRRLRDSNLLYSPLWRTFFQWWGSPEGTLFNNPIGDGKIGLAAMMELLNFKANHRKTVVTGRKSGELWGLVTSANPHSASALHGNVALSFEGPLAADLLRSEEAVYRMTTGESFPDSVRRFMERSQTDEAVADGDLSAVVLTERAIKDELLDRISQLSGGDSVDLALFYFADMDLRKALAQATSRGARVRLLMDPGKDAFGREKNGIPNRQVGAWLFERGVEVRWYRTRGEQFHSKMALFRYNDTRNTLVLGSANWTRRNLDNLNLETAVSLSGPSKSPVFVEAREYFSGLWSNEGEGERTGIPEGLIMSVPYSEYQDRSSFRKFLYWVMEKSGASTF